MTTTLSIDLNLTTAAESGLTSLPSLTPLTSTGLAGGDVRDVRVVSDIRPAVASDLVGRDVLVSPERSEHREAMSLEACAPTAVAGEAFRRAMAEPIAENAALGEAFAAAVAATAAEPSLTPSRKAAKAGDESSSLASLPSLDPSLTSLTSLTPLTSPDTAVATPLSSHSSATPAIIDGDVRDVRVVSDVRPASPAVAADSPEPGVVGASPSPLTPLTSPGLAEGDVRDVRVVSDVRLATPAVAADSPDTAIASSLSSHSSATPALIDGDVRDVRVVRDARLASPAVAADSLDSGVVGRDVLDAPTAEPGLTPSRRATEPGDEASSLASLPSLDSSLTSLTPLTPPDTSPVVAGERDARPYQAAAAVAPASVSATADVAASSAPSAVLVQAAEAVADTLLVSPGLLRGQGEIVVQLRPDVLDGTEVRIAVTGRQLDVQFCPTSVEMAVMLENGRAQIASHLSAKIASFNVTVDVRKKKA